MENEVSSDDEELPNDGNLFLSLLEFDGSPLVDVDRIKRRRFVRLHLAVLKALALGKYEKCWFLAVYLKSLLLKDELPVEFFAQPLKEVHMYLDVILTLCAHETQQHPLLCVAFCERHLVSHCYMYPVLFSIAAGCYIKLRMTARAMDVIRSGLYCIAHFYDEFLDEQQRSETVNSFFSFHKFADNSPSYVFYQLYAYGWLLKMPIDQNVREIGLYLTEDSLIPNIEVASHCDCCVGHPLKLMLLTYKHKENAEGACAVDYEAKSSYQAHGEHVLSHCQNFKVIVNAGYQTNSILYVHGNDEILMFLNEQHQASDQYMLSNSVGAERHMKRVKRGRPTLRVGNPYYICSFSHKLVKTIVLGLMKQFQRNIRLETDATVLYFQFLGPESQKCIFVMDEIREISERLIDIPTWSFKPTRNNRRSILVFISRYIRRLTMALDIWRVFVEYSIAYVREQCFPDGYPCNVRKLLHRLGVGITAKTRSARPSVAAKETQTNYSKFSCRAKQTQTDKFFPDELGLWKQVATLESNLATRSAKCAEVEAKILELAEEKKEYVENQNKIIRSLRRELSQARRTIVEKNKEVTYQKYQIEQLQTNLSKLNKPYSHVVKAPDEAQKALYYKNILRDNEKLQVLNANLSAENGTLQKQLDDLADAFDKMKARRDALLDTNEEVSLLYKDKCDQHDELCSQIQCLKVETTEKLQQEEGKLRHLQSCVNQRFQDFLNVLADMMSQYKIRCDRIYQELTYYFYSCTPNMNIKHMCESNQTFLNSMSCLFEKNLLAIHSFKNVLCHCSMDSFHTQVTAYNWKDIILSTEEFCTDLFNQYVHTLNAVMALHSALSTALSDNARLINQTISAPVAPMMEPEKYYRPCYYPNLPDRLPTANRIPMQPLQTLPQTSNLGPVGSNRPSSSMPDYVRSRPTSPLEIKDPSTKHILSQFGHAVNFPSTLVQNNPILGSGSNQGVIRRPLSSTPYSTPTGLGAVFQPRMDYPRADYTMKENFSYTPPSRSTFKQPAERDFNASGAKYREIFFSVKKRYPDALMSDLLHALNYLKSMNINLNMISKECVVEQVENYLDRQAQLRMKNVSPDSKRNTSTDDEECSICFEKLSLMPISTLKCLHIFHDKCIKTWIQQNNVCPICPVFTTLE